MSTSELATGNRSTAGTLELIQFVSGDVRDRKVLHCIVGSETWFACRMESSAHASDRADLEILYFSEEAKRDNDPWYDEAKSWCEAATNGVKCKSTLISLHGVDLYWSMGKVAIRCSMDRLDAARRAVLEFALAERELVSLENSVKSSWQTLEGDVPTAFAYSEAKVVDRAELGKRFQNAISLQARLSRIIPSIVQPAQYPPTLESQLHERLRERMRQEDRLEVLEKQLDIFQRVYEMCGQRSSDFMLTRSGNLLEWIIILLLAVQTIMAMIDYLPSSATGT